MQRNHKYRRTGNNKKISEEKELEHKRSQQELDHTLQMLKERDKNIEALERRIQSLLEKIRKKTQSDLKEELKYASAAKEKAEHEKLRLENQLEKIRQHQKERESRNTNISENELKRISQIAKTEQALQLFETNFAILKNNKNILKTDPDLKQDWKY
ncbi:hypothetical protein C823_007943 [Eubacterium plexicaudatum ASF492]|nr:hypothetical protein C823_007943 [Eubacterium plexicaudatum ASF492]